MIDDALGAAFETGVDDEIHAVDDLAGYILQTDGRCLTGDVSRG